VKSIGWSWHVPLFQWPLLLALGLLIVLAVGRFIRERTA